MSRKFDGSPLRSYLDRFPQSRILILVGPMNVSDGMPGREPIIYIDGGVRWRRGPGGFSVGDNDSADAPMDLRLPVDKDFSDLSFVLEHIPERIDDIRGVGLLGGRRDHELLVIGEVHRFLARRSRPARVSLEPGVAGVTAGRHEFDFAGVFSMIAFAPTHVRVVGAVSFALPQMTVLEAVSSRGLSNMAAGHFVIDCEGPVFIFNNQ